MCGTDLVQVEVGVLFVYRQVLHTLYNVICIMTQYCCAHTHTHTHHIVTRFHSLKRSSCRGGCVGGATARHGECAVRIQG